MTLFNCLGYFVISALQSGFSYLSEREKRLGRIWVGEKGGIGQ